MPMKYKYPKAVTAGAKRKFPRKKTTARKSQRMTVYRPPKLANGMPDIFYTKLRYHRIVTLNASAGSPDQWTWVANGLFNPDEYMGVPTGAHQPYMWDQLIAQYVNAVVLTSKCTARYCPSTTPAVSPINYVTLTCDKFAVSASTYTGLGSSSDYDHLCEAQKSKIVQMGPQSFPYKQERGGTLTAYFSPKRIFNCSPKSQLGDLGYFNNIASNPNSNNRAYFNLLTVAPEAASDPGAIQVEVLIEYSVCFTGLKISAQS